MTLLLLAESPAWVLWLPTVNASLNGLATILLIVGVVLIKQGRREAHRRVMLSAFATSCLFLACYLVYHAFVLSKKFPGEGPIRYVYYSILLTHVVLAAVVPFLALRTIYLGLKERWEQHRRLARITFPIWLYVSITGVVIYAMLYHWPVA